METVESSKEDQEIEMVRKFLKQIGSPNADTWVPEPPPPPPTEEELAAERLEKLNNSKKHWEIEFESVLPRDWMSRRLNDLEPSEAKTLITSLEPFGDRYGLLLMGKSGVGKTFAMAGLLNKILDGLHERGYDLSRNAAYYPIGYLIYQLRTKRDPPEFKICNERWALFLDDLGVENTTDFAREHFFTILDLRCQKKLPTYITTNLSLNELTQKYGERVTSRLKEMCLIVELKGSDKRTDIMRDRISILRNRTQK